MNTTMAAPSRSTDPGGTCHEAGQGPCEAWTEVFARVDRLSHREVDAFRLLAMGASNRLIAARLGVTERTVKAHVAQILAKLEVESRLQAGIVAFAWATLATNGAGSSLRFPPAMGLAIVVHDDRQVRRSGRRRHVPSR